MSPGMAAPTNTEQDVNITIKTITPELAEQMLKRNEGNRKMNQSTVSRYAAEMVAGNWDMNGEAIKFAKGGRLLDGQHRLAACVKSKTPFVTAFVTDLLDSSQMTMDQGTRRSIGQQLKLSGVKYPHVKSSVARIIHAWEYGRVLGSTGRRPLSVREVSEVIGRWPMIDDACRMASRAYEMNRNGIRRSTLAIFFTMALESDREHTEAFAEAYSTGAGLESGHPVLTLRNQIVSFSSTRRLMSLADKLSWFVSAWSAMKAGKARRSYNRGAHCSDFPGLSEKKLKEKSEDAK